MGKDPRKRLFNSLAQHARQQQLPMEKVESTVAMMMRLNESIPQSGQMLQRIGRTLLHEDCCIIAPACPDYSHRNGKYTFCSLGGGVSLLTQLQIDFLLKLSEFIQNCKIMILVADHEADDESLCKAVSKSQAEFRELVFQSIAATRAIVKPYGWSAEAMTDVIPDLVARETANMVMLQGPEYFARLNSYTSQRSMMYQMICGSLTPDEMLERTIKTAAQYIAMGEVAVERHWVLCNHSTVNLCWYKTTSSAVINNPVTVY